MPIQNKLTEKIRELFIREKTMSEITLRESQKIVDDWIKTVGVR